ncbi:hypothetical protein DFJ73DRAFT_864483 [Zopfochytrium polystomum]|nr:hypothetical protein DFJ73DRAFT_864483 [Zopfochytrium polystomum]
MIAPPASSDTSKAGDEQHNPSQPVSRSRSTESLSSRDEEHPNSGNHGSLRDVNEALQTKIMELKSQLTELNEKSDRDRAAANEDIQKKNAVIDRMRVKLNRYEFALKEAILFLSKPMDAYEAWLNQRQEIQSSPSQDIGLTDCKCGSGDSQQNNVGQNNSLLSAINATVALANPSLSSGAANGHVSVSNLIVESSQPSAGFGSLFPSWPVGTGAPRSRATSSAKNNPSGNAYSATSPASDKRSVSSVGLVDNGRPSSASWTGQLVTTSTSAPGATTCPGGSSPTTYGGATPLEIQCLECMRLALNYLKNAQASVQNIDSNVAVSNVSTVQSLFPSLFEESKDEAGKAQSTFTDETQWSDRASRPTGLIITVELEDKHNSSKLTGTLCPACGNSTTQVNRYPSKPSTLPEQECQQQTLSSVGSTRHGFMSKSASSASIGSNSATAGCAATTSSSKARTAALARLNSPERRVTVAKANNALLHAAVVMGDGDGDGDIGDIYTSTDAESLASQKQRTVRNDHSSNSNGTAFNNAIHRCSNCRELLLQQDRLHDTIAELRDDVTSLANQLEATRAALDRVQLSKDILDQEIEELTAQLFDQANRMVIDEARLRDELETSNRDLRGELKTLAKQLDALKIRSGNRPTTASPLNSISNLIAVANGTSRPIGPTHAFYAQMNLSPPRLTATAVAAATLQASLSSLSSSASSIAAGSLPTLPLPTLPIDGIHFAEFQDHVKQTSMLTTITPPQSLSAFQSTAFMRRCMAEDVEPCLFYAYAGYPGAVGGIFTTGAGKTQNGLLGVKKRVLESMIRGVVDVVRLADCTADEGHTSQGQIGCKMKCASCSLLRECPFRLRLAHKNGIGSPTGTSGVGGEAVDSISIVPISIPVVSPDSFSICRLCRDRIAAVVDFFTYMRTLIGPRKQGIAGGGAGAASIAGTAGLTILGMFRHVTWLRRRMSASRVGSCALFDLEPLMLIERKVGEGEWEKSVQILQ